MIRVPFYSRPVIGTIKIRRKTSMLSINNISFNQSHTCVSISTSEYYKIFNCEPFGEFYSSSHVSKKSISLSEDGRENVENSDRIEPTACLKMLFSTSLTIIVPDSNSKGGNRLLKIYNLKHNLKICELTFPSHIVDIRLNRKRLIVFLEIGQIYIYDLSCVRLIKVLEIQPFSSFEQGEKQELVGDLGSDDSSFLILPLSYINDQTDLFNFDSGSQSSEFVKSKGTPLKTLDSFIEFTQKNNKSEMLRHTDITLENLKKDGNGWVIVYDTIHLKPVKIYKAHDSEVAKMAISNDNQKIVTASTKGTILRVCHMDFKGDVSKLRPRISQISNFRRGHHLARINTLSFNQDSSILACGSESDTIHLFKLDSTSIPRDEDSSNESEIDDESNKSSDDLNENLANLLISKPSSEKEDKGYFGSTLKKSSKLLNNSYTKSIMKKLPYGDYFKNLIWVPPRRSFAYIKLPEYALYHNNLLNKTEVGFSGPLVIVASYQTGKLYQFQLPNEVDTEKREECFLVNYNNMI